MRLKKQEGGVSVEDTPHTRTHRLCWGSRRQKRKSCCPRNPRAGAESLFAVTLCEQRTMRGWPCVALVPPCSLDSTPLPLLLPGQRTCAQP